MSDYQAVYDAVRSRFHCSLDGGDIANSIASMFFPASQHAVQAQYDAQHAEAERVRPSVLFRPDLRIDGNAWSALYGPNIQEGVVGFGDSPDEAMRAFDRAWSAKLDGATLRIDTPDTTTPAAPGGDDHEL